MSASQIGNLSVSLTMNTAAFQKGATLAEKRAAAMEGKFKGLTGSLNGIAGSLKGISLGLAAGAGAAAVAGLAAIANNAFQMGSALTEAAAKVGVTVEALQEMRYVAEQNGVSIETMEGSLNKMTRTLGELQLQNPATTKTFEALGLSAKEFIDLTPTESFTKIVDALSKIEDETVRAAIGNKIFGRSYAELKPIVDLGAAGIRKAAEEKRKDGVLSTEQAATLDDLADGWDKLTGKLGVAAAQFIANQAGTNKASQGLEAFGENVGDVIREIEKLLALSRRIDTFFNNLQIKFQERLRDSALTSWIPGVSEQAQLDINRLQATNQRNTSNGGGRRGVRGGTGRVPRSPAAGGVLAGTMAGAGAGALATLESLERKAANINTTVAAPVIAATTKITAAFEELSDRVQPLLDRLFPEVRALVDYKAGQNDLKAWLDAGKISIDQFNESLIRLRDSYFGTDGPTGILQDDSWIENVTESLPDLADQVNKTSGLIRRSNDEWAESFEDSAQRVLGSISNLASSIKGGGFLDILDGIASLFLTLGSVGTFGSDIAGRINKPRPGMARGGNVTSGRSYLVGERGPEIFSTNRPGFITANNELNKGGGRVPVHIIPSPYFDVVVDGRADGRVATASPGIASAAAQGVQTNLAQSQFRTLP